MSLYQIQTMSKKETTYGKERVEFKKFDSIETFSLDNPNDVKRLYELKANHCTSSIIRESLGRGTLSFTYSDTISLDFDSGKTINEIHSLLNGYAYIVYGSKSNQIDKEVPEEFEVDGKKVTKKVIKNNERFHVDLYLGISNNNGKITESKTYSKLFEKLIEKFGSDKNAKNSDRIISSSLNIDGQLSEINRQLMESEIERFNKTFNNSKFYNVDDLLEEIELEIELEIEDEKIKRNKELVQNNDYLSEQLDKAVDKLESAIKFLYGKGKSIDHDDRLTLACGLYYKYGEQGKSILLNIKDSEGTRRCWNSAVTNKYTDITKGNGICKIAKKLGWIDSSMFSEKTQNILDQAYNNNYTISMNADKIREYSDKKKRVLDDETLSKPGKDAEIKQIDAEIKPLEKENERLKKESKTLVKDAEKVERKEKEKDLIKEQEIKNDNFRKEMKLKTEITPTRENIVPFFNSFMAKIKNSSNVVVEKEDVCLIMSLEKAAIEFENIGEYIDKDKIGSKFVTYFQRWRESPLRRLIDEDKIVCKSHEKVEDDEINTFRAKYAVDRIECTDDVKKVIERFFFESLSNSDEYLNKWMLNWVAGVIQYYFTGVLVINVGTFGTGKSKLGELIKSILGNGGLITKEERGILGNFNKVLENKYFVSIEELTGLNDERLANGFKSLINSPYITIEPKGKESYEIRNTANWYISSNNLKLHTDLGGRRFVAIKSSDKFDKETNPKGWDEMFTPLTKIIGGQVEEQDKHKLGQVLDYFLNIVVDKNMFINNLPSTLLKSEIRSESLSFVENFMIEVYNNNGIIQDTTKGYYVDLYSNKILCDKGGLYSNVVVSTKMIFDIYLQYFKDRRTYMNVVKDFNKASTIRQKYEKGNSNNVRTHEFDPKMIYDYFKLRGLSDLLIKTIDVKPSTPIQSNNTTEIKTNVIEPVKVVEQPKIEDKEVIKLDSNEIKQELNEVVDVIEKDNKIKELESKKTKVQQELEQVDPNDDFQFNGYELRQKLKNIEQELIKIRA